MCMVCNPERVTVPPCIRHVPKMAADVVPAIHHHDRIKEKPSTSETISSERISVRYID